MFSPAAIAAKGPAPDGIKLFDERIDKCGIVGEDTVLEVALSLRLCPHPRASKIGATKVCLHAINDYALEMNTWTEHPFHRRPKSRITVEVIPPV